MSEHTIRAQTEHPEEAILAFSKGLGEDVDTMSRLFLPLKQEHAHMHDFWRGEQYDRFSAFLDATVADAVKQLKLLHAMEGDLARKAKLLREAQRYSVNLYEQELQARQRQGALEALPWGVLAVADGYYHPQLGVVTEKGEMEVEIY